MNERNTENLVRKMLVDKGYDNDNVIVEEQQSKIPKVQKLLKNASKKGNGIGRPEFIISFKDKPDNLVVIECKSSTLDHQSKDVGDASKYAVDGALLYANYLKEEFNVTAIGVSGESKEKNRISTYLWKKKSYVAEKINDGDFLTPQDISNFVTEKSKSLSHEKLVETAVSYNLILEDAVISEPDRCLLISSILVALQHKPFVLGYKEYIDNKELLNALHTACASVLNENNLDESKCKVILHEYTGNKYNETLTSNNNTILNKLIEDIEKDILPSVKEKDFDILGNFYTQFIRYAGNDSKIGLVLTPSHITDFFCDVVNLGIDDIVFDPCCGTGGFLVSAMNYMIQKASYNGEKIKKIRSKQLIGIEKGSDMFSHACSNMMMRGDGKSNIYFGSCFDAGIKSKIKLKNPNVTFLNPPYYHEGSIKIC